MQHECKQTQRLRFLWQQLSHKPAQKHGLLGEIATGDIGPTGVGPAFPECRVDSLQHGVEPAGKVFGPGDAKRNTGLPDLVLGTNEPLTHGCRRHEERRGDQRRIQSQHHLQNERRTDADLDGRMRTGEHQRETLVRDFRVRRRGVQPLREDLQLSGRCLTAVPSPGEIDHLSPGDGQQPGFRVRRTAVARPICQRRSKRLRQRIFGGGHIPRACREKGDELAVTAAHGRFRSAPRPQVAFAGAHAPRPSVVDYTASGQIGRTSTTP